MRCTVRQDEPGLLLPDLPRGVTEVTLRRDGRVMTFSSRKPWREVMRMCEERFTEPGKPLGGPEPVKIKGER